MHAGVHREEELGELGFALALGAEGESGTVDEVGRVLHGELGDVGVELTGAVGIDIAALDADGDGELTYREARAVTDLGAAFVGDKDITSFNEFRSFGMVSSIQE